MKISLGRMSPSITNLGPGKRIGLWVAGCSRGCPGCMSSEMAVKNYSRLVDTTDVINEILRYAPLHNGLTISGGEPFEQAAALSELLAMVRERTNLDVLVYTGYTLQEICTADYKQKKMLSYIDILIDGPFLYEMSNNKLWRGSDNQVMHLLTPAALKYKKYVDAEYEGNRSMIVEFDEDGTVHITGIPERGVLRKMKRELENEGVILKSVNRF